MSLPEYVKVVKSPTHEGIEQIPASPNYDFMPVSIVLSGGITVSNTEQFQDEDADETESE